VSRPLTTIGVIGGGAWGTALANAAAVAGRDVVLWMRDAAQGERVQTTRINARYLPGVRLHDRVTATAAPDALHRAGAILLVTPAQTARGTVERFSSALAPGAPLVVCAKGIEQGTGRFLTDVVMAVRPDAPVAVLSGPSFAGDVARGLPTAVTLAARDAPLAAALAAALSGPTFRVYHGTDVRGVEIGGAAKNVLAIAAGIVVGRQLGASALAALTTRGFSELARLGRACGARSETLAGLSGLGDLILSCSSLQSRNFTFGIALGSGEAPNRDKLAEGEFTAPVLIELAASQNVDMPVSNAVAAILSGKVTIDAAIEGLLTRPFKAEE
jgi:glycerol-3-phosphate dehydrogenase (NAD(P)+)